MTLEVVRASVPRSVRVNGRPFLVPVPSVLTVLTIAATVEAAARFSSLTSADTSDEAAATREDDAVFREALAAWLPQEGLDVVLDPLIPFAQRRAILTAWIFEGIPMPRPAVARAIKEAGRTDVTEAADPLAGLLAFDAAEGLAQVGHYFGLYPAAVLREGFPGFVLALREVQRAKAQDDLRLLTLRSLPYIENEDERDAVVQALRVTGGMEDDEATMTPEARAERGRRNLEALKERLGVPDSS